MDNQKELLETKFELLSSYPPELIARFNSFITTEFDDSLTVEMQLRSIIKWASKNFLVVDDLIKFINELTNFLKAFMHQFDVQLEETIITILTEWQASGQLDVFISEALQWELDGFKATTEQNFLSVNQQLQQNETNILNVSADVTELETTIGTLGTTSVFKGSATNAEIFALTGMSVGDEWFDTTNNQSVRWNGTNWVSVGSTVKIGSNSVTADMTTPLNKIGFVFYHGQAETMQLLESDRTLRIYPNAYILVGNKKYNIERERALTYSNTSLYQYVYYDTVLDTFRFVYGTLENTIKDSEVFVGGLNLNNDITIRNFWTTNRYRINGVEHMGVPQGEQLPFNKMSVLGGLALYSSTHRRNVSLDEKGLSVRFHAPFNFTYGNKRYQFTETQTIPLLTNSLYQYVVMDTKTKVFRVIPAAQENTIKETEVLVSYFLLNGDLTFKHVFGTYAYKIDNNELNETSKKLYVSKTPLHEYKPADKLYTHMNAVADLYDAYDALISLDPHYLSKVEQGKDASGDYSLYVMTANKGGQVMRNGGKKPTIVITPGVHGGERNSVNSFYYLMEDIVKNWKTNPVCYYLYWHVRLVFTPCANPYAYQNGIRANANGVDINRNFSEGWTLGTVGDPFYGGTEPFSEIETRVLRDMIQSNPNAMAFYDYHTNGSTGTEYTNLLWFMNAGGHYYDSVMDAISQSVLDTMTAHMQMDYNVPVTESKIGYTTYETTGGTASVYASTLIRHATTFEVFNKYPFEVSNSSQRTLKSATDAMGNVLVHTLNYFK